MARWMKADGTEQEVHPAGREFTSVELHNMVDGSFTALVQQHRANLRHIQVYGDVVVADFSETGDE